MRGTWKATGPGRGTWKTDGDGDWTQLAYVVLAVFALFGVAAAVGPAVKHARTEMELIFAAGTGFLAVAVTATVLLYRWTHPRYRIGPAGELTATGVAPAVTATVVPEVPATQVPQALPAVQEIHDALSWLDIAIAGREKYIRGEIES